MEITLSHISCYFDESTRKYNVSKIDTHGDEIACLADFDDIDDAWARAKRAAQKNAITAELSPLPDGQVSQRWTPATLHDYDTAAHLRVATPGEVEASRAAAEHDGGAGVITLDIDGQDDRRCYVQE